MINTHHLQNVIDRGLNHGADFVEIFIEETRSERLQYLNKRLKEAVGGIDYGIGIRLIKGTEAYYAHTSDDSLEKLLLTVDGAAQSLGLSKANKKNLPALNTQKIFEISSAQKTLSQIPLTEKIALLKVGDEAARAVSNNISQVAGVYFEQLQKVRIVNSEGLDLSDNRERCRISFNVIASSGSENQVGTESPGARQGWEFMENLDVVSVARKAAQRADLMLRSDHTPSGVMPVIIASGFGGVIFHEACGHPLESYAITRNSSVFVNKMGQQIASPLVSAVDDGTLDKEWGSLSIDDEGTPTTRTTLIENGILKSYMVDRLGAAELDMAPTGSGRRESYRYAPVSRMRNTFILPGTSSLEEMILTTENGLYAASLGGGSVNPATGEFNFAVTEGYLIQNGKISKPVRGAVLIGKGHEILLDIDMVGKDLSLAQGMCGATSGWVPVNVGQPALRVKNMIVGGRS